MDQQLFEKKIDAAAFNDLSPDDPWKEPGKEAGGAVAEVAQVGPEASRRGDDVGALHLCNCVRTKHDSHHQTHIFSTASFLIMFVEMASWSKSCA